MEKIIVYLDDASYAQQQLAPMTSAGAPGARTHWVLVACAPRMTQHISKFVTHSARQTWRAKWADKLFQQIAPHLTGRGDSVTTVLAKGPLQELTRKLSAEHATSRVLDARRPKFGQDLQPVTAGQQTDRQERWSVPGAVLGMGAVLVLAAE
jgi:pyridoxal/pyridoxine/pyridoxamine kinase